TVLSEPRPLGSGAIAYRSLTVAALKDAYGRETTPMRWFQTEYILKGLFLGLILYAGLEEAKAPYPQHWQMLGYVNLGALAGLAGALLVAALLKLREGYRVRGRL